MYKEQYYEIINYRKEHPLPNDEYGENHHIIPRSLSGTNKKENIVRLLPEEHYRCHCLLPYVYLEEGDKNGYHKMLHAWVRLSHSPQNSHPDLSFVDRDSEEYGRLRRDYAKCRSLEMTGKKMKDETKRKLSESKMGERNPFYGKHLSEEHKTKISDSGKRRWEKVDRKEISQNFQGENNPFYGKKHTEDFKNRLSETRQKEGNPAYGKRFFCNPERTEHVFAYECPEGWIPGMKYIPKK